jgi:hypothetical protein
VIRKTHKLALTRFPVFLVTASAAKQASFAVEEFRSLQERVRESRTNNDWRSHVTNAMKLKEPLNEAPRSLLELARADVRAGDFQAPRLFRCRFLTPRFSIHNGI